VISHPRENPATEAAGLCSRSVSYAASFCTAFKFTHLAVVLRRFLSGLKPTSYDPFYGLSLAWMHDRAEAGDLAVYRCPVLRWKLAMRKLTLLAPSRGE
jgi:hypothetical protein